MRRLEEEMQKAIADGVFPGAALLVASQGDILYRGFFGKATLLPSPEPVTDKTLFDIASLTKPVATTTLLQISRKEKGTPLNAPVSRYLKAFDDETKKKITIRHLLKHTSGLPAWKPYYREIAQEHPESIGKRESKKYFLEKITQEPLEMPISYKHLYSDLGFLLLGFLLESLWEMPLDQLFSEKVAAPLGLNRTFYRPLEGIASSIFKTSDFAATEQSSWRKRLIRGEVHDDNAYALGGIAGHAGLFSTIDDLHRFLSFLEKGLREQDPFLSMELLHEFIGPKMPIKLGWDTPSVSDSQAGGHFSKNSIGHLGYSGCSFWADLDKDFHVVLLTNRVHPSSDNETIKVFRPHLHNVIYEHFIQRQQK